MKKFFAATIAALSVLAVAGIAGAAVGGKALPKTETPVLVVHVGMPGDGERMAPPSNEQGRERPNNNDAKNRPDERKPDNRQADDRRPGNPGNGPDGNGRGAMGIPQASELKNGGYKTVMVMIGSYADKNGNTKNSGDLEKLLKEAKSRKIEVVAVHDESSNGKNKKPTVDTKQVDTVLKYANHVVVMKNGDSIDSRMSSYARKKDIPLSTIDSARDMTPGRNDSNDRNRPQPPSPSQQQLRQRPDARQPGK